ncbi:MAG TPA: hypothetical protein VII11_00270, partial [Bacteroidota bacterium]
MSKREAEIEGDGGRAGSLTQPSPPVPSPKLGEGCPIGRGEGISTGYRRIPGKLSAGLVSPRWQVVQLT